jgi:signal transduction histidine kinase
MPRRSRIPARITDRVFRPRRERVGRHTAVMGTSASVFHGEPAAEHLALLGTRVSQVAHDLRHHFASIYANVEFMADPHTLQDDREQLMEEVQSAVYGATAMLETMVTIARTGRCTHQRKVSIARLIKRMVALVRTHPDGRSVEIVCRELASVKAPVDGARLSSAVYNLVLNACQAAVRGNPHPRVEVVLEDEGHFIRLRVFDNGPGVPDAIRACVFQPFVKSARSSGLGLGLAIVEQVAAEHNGFVSIESGTRESGRLQGAAFSLFISKCGSKTSSDARPIPLRRVALDRAVASPGHADGIALATRIAGFQQLDSVQA